MHTHISQLVLPTFLSPQSVAIHVALSFEVCWWCVTDPETGLSSI